MSDRWTEWVIDASLSRDGLFCFCPVEGDLAGEYSIVTGFNILSDRPPQSGKFVAVIHPDGQEAVEEWCQAHDAALTALSRIAGGTP